MQAKDIKELVPQRKIEDILQFTDAKGDLIFSIVLYVPQNDEQRNERMMLMGLLSPVNSGAQYQLFKDTARSEGKDLDTWLDEIRKHPSNRTIIDLSQTPFYFQKI